MKTTIDHQTKNLNLLVKTITTTSDRTSKEAVKKKILALQDIDCSIYPDIDCSLIVGRAVASLNDIISTIEQIELKQEQEDRETELIIKQAKETREEELRKGEADFDSKMEELRKRIDKTTTIEKLNTLRDRLEVLSNSEFSNPLHIQEMETRISYRDRDILLSTLFDMLKKDLNEIIEDTEKTDKVMQYLQDNGLFEL